MLPRVRALACQLRVRTLPLLLRDGDMFERGCTRPQRMLDTSSVHSGSVLVHRDRWIISRVLQLTIGQPFSVGDMEPSEGSAAEDPYYFGERSEAVGEYRACWRDSDDAFFVDIGVFQIQGPHFNQEVECSIGTTCTVVVTPAFETHAKS